MRALLPSIFRNLAASSLVVLAAACSSSTEPDDVDDVDNTPANFEVTYSLTGTYTGRPGNAVAGTLVVSSQAGSAATVAISVLLNDHGNIFFALNAVDPGVSATSTSRQATVKSDGSFSVTFSGREVIDGIDPASCCNYTFEVVGVLTGSSIQGSWTLTRDMPSLDTGTFTAAR
jgi:hypothetical protein